MPKAVRKRGYFTHTRADMRIRIYVPVYVNKILRKKKRNKKLPNFSAVGARPHLTIAQKKGIIIYGR